MKIDKRTDAIRGALKNQGIKSDAPISESTPLRDDLHFDSFAPAELTVKIEAQFGVDVFEDSIVYTVGDVGDSDMSGDELAALMSASPDEAIFGQKSSLLDNILATYEQ